MAAGKIKYRVLVASSGEKIHDYFSSLLPPDEYEIVCHARNAGETRRVLLSQSVDIVIVNTPLSDEFGTELALDLSEGIMGVMLVVKAELFERVAVSAKLAKMEKKNRSLIEKMTDIRTVNRAKWLLIENLNMTENDAHHYIEKQAMDTRLSRREVAEGIIRTYDK